MTPSNSRPSASLGALVLSGVALSFGLSAQAQPDLEWGTSTRVVPLRLAPLPEASSEWSARSAPQVKSAADPANLNKTTSSATTNRTLPSTSVFILQKPLSSKPEVSGAWQPETVGPRPPVAPYQEPTAPVPKLTLKTENEKIRSLQKNPW